jgi:peptidylprolyl isomerase
VAAGDASEAVTAEGDLGAKPEVTFDAPLQVDATERSVLVEGDGDEAVEGSIVHVQFSLINGTSGEEIDATAYDGSADVEFTLDDSYLTGLVSTLECTTAGSRVVGVIPPADLFGSQGSTDLGVAADDSVVFVADLVEVLPEPAPALERADGEDQAPEKGFPTVELAENGAPTVTIPDADPPKETRVATLKKGSGTVVGDGDTVTVHYTGVIWRTGEVFDSSWDRGTPAEFPTGGVIAGFSQALVGATVGSQVIAVIPPDQGYGEAGQPSAGIEGTDTLVFVVDVLATR